MKRISLLLINQLNTYETPEVLTLGTFELPQVIVVANSPTTANVYLYGLYNPYFIPPTSYKYNSPTLFNLKPLL